MTASKNANNAAAAGGAGGGGGGSTSATTSDGDYRLMPHEVINSPTTSYEVYNVVIILGYLLRHCLQCFDAVVWAAGSSSGL